jgi:concanavalin A-like lectin/glucanase superfamily protein
MITHDQTYVGILSIGCAVALGVVASAQVGVTSTGMNPTKVTCRNVTTGQSLTVKTTEASPNCETLGLKVNPSDKVRVTAFGDAPACGEPPLGTSGLIGLWHLDGNADDSSGSGNHGIISGAGVTPISDGVVGSAYSFNGVDNIDVGNLDFSGGQYTVSLWIRTAFQTAYDDYRMAIGKGNTSTGDMTFELMLIDGHSHGPQFPASNDANYLVWRAGSTLVNSIWGRPIVNLRNGSWHMLTAVYANGSQQKYVDGAVVNNDSYAGPLPLVADHVKIGGFNNFGPYHHPWIGNLDEVSIYTRALTTTEVGRLYRVPRCQGTS